MIECRGVAKRFYYYSARAKTLRESIIRRVLRRPSPQRGAEFTLSGFDLVVPRGDVVALIGTNGSGKSTILRLMAGIYTPDEGSIVVNGRLTAVMELGAGFHEDLTGLENVVLYGAVMGMTPAELERHRDEILAFADIGDFIHHPVRYYSTGMQARLAFAVAMSISPDVVLLDEALAVGDESFRDRCIQKLGAFREGGGTIVVVSHDLQAVSDLCERAVWIDAGTVRMTGEAWRVVEAYREAMHGEGAGGETE